MGVAQVGGDVEEKKRARSARELELGETDAKLAKCKWTEKLTRSVTLNLSELRWPCTS
ncbi:hypothetical protein PC116_g28365 [Phytophthora cactorum]|uniref:Uncharacterized protein n=1 Tax=Phytophthora cactorum TaxID=29920 RepID=A0A8T1JJG6_9STRA|nr:hypothetical protein Pcac1_g22262 [Phytophthora cactorum]KAG2792421.1 hypothetical protein PC112_g23870 [Phytophthora cactorum]KAG2957739.1 hypothetical protein PC118_g23877 [Phytophthora cactorum]KAG3048054.1 hypothetical protein PC122_g23944 [Phytophthora cactorum]KAG3133103.1 hypothetical protein PC128_g26387 [Phytophthora cactorum]